jgi:hypothetical protein
MIKWLGYIIETSMVLQLNKYINIYIFFLLAMPMPMSMPMPMQALISVLAWKNIYKPKFILF